ncbi:MAG TPA: universal stress protein [Ktedonobacterales bacterium]|nr:universal stress protein [Ktedonobacterales bacterium]
MAKRILVPIEGGARDAEALAVARHLARQIPAGIVMVHVAPMYFDTREIVAAERRLDEYVQALRAEGIDAHFLMEYGEPATGIAKVARQHGAEIIVLAPEHRALLETLWHPRVSTGLLGHSATPLFILPDVPPDVSAPELLSDPNAKVIAAVDGSQNAEAALPLAIQLAQSYQRPLLLVRVVAPIFILGAGVEALKAQREAQYAEKAEAHRYLVESRERIAAETQLPVETNELVGPVAEHLTQLAASHHGSVLVMGTHGRSGLARVAIGSVAAEVMERASTPVIIVPSRPGKDAPGQ